MKKVLSVLLAVCLIWGVMPVLASAAVTEVEKNDNYATAQDIPINEPVTGNLMYQSDLDYYRFSLSGPGCVRFQFEHDLIPQMNCWSVSVYSEDFKLMSNNVFSGDEKLSKTDGLGLPAGSYYLLVKLSRHYSDIPYTLTVNFTPSQDWETELNNTFDTADTISTNRTVTGSSNFGNDPDYYTFVLDAPGQVSLGFKHEYLHAADDPIRWSSYLYTENFKQLFSVSSRASDNEKCSEPIGLPAGIYYVKVLPYDDMNSYTTPYELTVNYTASDTCETELNDTFSTADEIQSDMMYAATMSTSGDVDYYQIQIPEAARYTLNVQHEYVEDGPAGSLFWSFEIFDESYKSLNSFSVKGNEMETKTQPFGLSSGTYYLKVAKSYNFSPIVYNFGFIRKSDEPSASPSPDVPVSTPTPDPVFKMTDVKADAYFRAAVNWALKEGITSGVAADRFGVGSPCKREQIATFLWRANGSPEASKTAAFADMTNNSVFNKAISWAVEQGITSGVGNNKFGVGQTCTRVQAVTFLWIAAGKPTPEKQAAFSDMTGNPVFNNAISWAVENGITSGTGGNKFSPNKPCTREQIVTFLYNAYK